MFYESHYLEELGRQRIEALRKEAEEERHLKMAEPNRSEIKRVLPYALAFASIVIAIVVI